MNKICTSIEQSQKLIYLGIDVNTADMFYADIVINAEHKYNLHPLESYGFKTFKDTKERESAKLKFIPAWSLSALLSILSTIIDYSYEFVFLKQTTNGRGDRLKNVYRCSVDMKDIWNIEPLDAAFEMIIWLKENNNL